MTGTFHRRVPTGATIAALAALWASADIFVYFHFVSLGAPLDLAFALAFALAPVLLSLALRAPLLFPFCAYVFVLPVDSLSRVSSFGTVAKLAGIVCAIAVIVRLVRKRDALPVSRAIVVWAALIAWMAITVFWAPSAAEATSSLSQYVALFALLAILAAAPVTRADLAGIYASIVLAGAMASTYQIYLFRTGTSILHGAGRVELKIGDYQIDPNDFAGSLVLPAALATWALFELHSRYAKLAAGIALALILGGLAASASRGGILATSLMIGYVIFRSRHRLRIAVAAGLGVFAIVVSNPSVVLRFQEAQDGTGAGRTDIWHTGLYAFRERWFAGWGLGGFPDAFDANHLNVFASYVDGWHWYAHSSLLTIATELGIIGFAIWLVALWQQLRLLRIVSRRNPLYELRTALEGAFLGVFLAGAFTTNINLKYTWLCYAAIGFLRGFVLRHPAAASDATQVLSARPVFAEGLAGTSPDPRRR